MACFGQYYIVMESPVYAGGQEHRDLCLSQLIRLESPNRYVYKEKASKGGLAQLKLEHKSVTIMANPSSGIRCPVHLLHQ